MRWHFVEEVVVVRNEEDRAFVTLERDIERVDGFEIEVVGGLVENENIRFEQHERQKRMRAVFRRRRAL